MNGCYVQFRSMSYASLQNTITCVERIAEMKRSGSLNDDQMRACFTNEQLLCFWNPSADEMKQ